MKKKILDPFGEYPPPHKYGGTIPPHAQHVHLTLDAVHIHLHIHGDTPQNLAETLGGLAQTINEGTDTLNKAVLDASETPTTPSGE